MLLATFALAAAAAVEPFHAAGSPPASIVVVLDAQAEPGEARGVMLDRLNGIIARLDRKGAAKLATCAASPVAHLPPTAKRWCTAVCQPKLPQRPVARWDVLRDDRGQWYAANAATPEEPCFEIDHDAFATQAASWNQYRGDFAAAKDDPAAGTISKLIDPVPGWWVMNKQTLGDRFLAGRRTSLSGAARKLETTEYLVRLPKGWKPQEACGILVWVEAADESNLARPLADAADELRLIVAGARHTGNDVLVPERFQFALDAVQTLRERFLCDPGRTYISGISGGGKIASQLWCCFPDVFTGAIPVVGLDGYEAVPAGAGKVFVPHFAKPAAPILKLLRPLRMAAITGDQDFNLGEVQGFARVYVGDGLNVRVIDLKGLGHEFPPAAEFTAAVRWVDEPAAARDVPRLSKARDLFEQAALQQGEARCALLQEVTIAAPWTEPAWKAAAMLKDSALPTPK